MGAGGREVPLLSQAGAVQRAGPQDTGAHNMFGQASAQIVFTSPVKIKVANLCRRQTAA